MAPALHTIHKCNPEALSGNSSNSNWKFWLRHPTKGHRHSKYGWDGSRHLPNRKVSFETRRNSFTVTLFLIITYQEPYFNIWYCKDLKAQLLIIKVVMVGLVIVQYILVQILNMILWWSLPILKGDMSLQLLF